MAPLVVAVNSFTRALQRSRCVAGGTAGSGRTSACGPVPSSCAKSAALTEFALTELALSASDPSGVAVAAAARKCIDGEVAAWHRREEGVSPRSVAIPPPPAVVVAPPAVTPPPSAVVVAPAATELDARSDGPSESRADGGVDGAGDGDAARGDEPSAATEAEAARARGGGPCLRVELRPPSGGEGDDGVAKAPSDQPMVLSSPAAPPGASTTAAVAAPPDAATARSGAASPTRAAGAAALPLEEHLDRESRAAAAAAALLRRLAKVGPEKTPQEAALAWVSSSKVGTCDGRGPVRRRRLDPSFVKATSRGGARVGLDSRRSESEMAWWMEESTDRGAALGARRGVRFNLRSSTVHEIPAYAEIYGRHPREFVFGRHSDMLPAGDRFGFVGQQADSDTDDDSTDTDVPSTSEDQSTEFQEHAGAASEELHAAHTAVAVC
mmetsp:Transcript_22474/g.64615  ORF Transcript_22474/g.64615 Transcript_22474/m.64615 type:complete len:439 (-) Transcript_22474:99-1415(-)